MTGATFAQLIILLGPGALGLIQTLASNWNKTMTLDEVMSACSVASESVEQFRAEARAKLIALGQLQPESNALPTVPLS